MFIWLIEEIVFSLRESYSETTGKKKKKYILYKEKERKTLILNLTSYVLSAIFNNITNMSVLFSCLYLYSDRFL